MNGIAAGAALDPVRGAAPELKHKVVARETLDDVSPKFTPQLIASTRAADEISPGPTKSTAHLRDHVVSSIPMGEGSTRATHQAIVALPTDKEGIHRPADHLIVKRASLDTTDVHERVPTLAGHHPAVEVNLDTAGGASVAGAHRGEAAEHTTGKDVAASPADQHLVAAPGSIAGVDIIVADTSAGFVRSRISSEDVIGLAALDVVAASTSPDPVPTRRPAQDVGALAAAQDIGTVSPSNAVVAAKTRDHVTAQGADQPVVAVAARQRDFLARAMTQKSGRIVPANGGRGQDESDTCRDDRHRADETVAPMGLRHRNAPGIG